MRSKRPRQTIEIPLTTTAANHVRCAVYTRKSTDEGLEQEFNSLDAQREAAEAYIASQRHEGWSLIPDHFDDGGYTGANMDRPALTKLLTAVEARKVDCVVVYKVDRLSRSLLDFAKLMESFDRCGVSFVSVTQQFNTTSSLGRLTLNILLSFAQFERELISERTRDKMSAARKKGKWVGGHPVLGYDIDPNGGRLVINAGESGQVKEIFDLYLRHNSLMPVVHELDRLGWHTKRWKTEAGRERGGKPFIKKSVYMLLTNPLYTGFVNHKGKLYRGEHEALVDEATWNLVQSNLHHNGHTNGGGNKNKYGALLRGLLFCTPCGAPMVHTYTTREPKLYRYYVCYNAQQKGWKSCETKSVSAPGIETAVLDSIRALGRNEKLRAQVVAGVKADDRARLAQIETEQDELRKKLQKLNGDLARHAAEKKSSSAARFDRIAGLQQEIEAVERNLAKLAMMLKATEEAAADPDDIQRTLERFDPSLGVVDHARAGETCPEPGHQGGLRRPHWQGDHRVPAHPRKRSMSPKHEQPVRTCPMTEADTGLQVETVLSRPTRGRRQAIGARPGVKTLGPRLPRVTRLMALAIKFEDMVARGEVGDYADIARLGHITRARATQVMNLLHLAPDIQEQLLFLSGKSQFAGITERELRRISATVSWKDQRKLLHSPHRAGDTIGQ